jgi:alkanesulfonate monooxygenase SsuD/methylene tetrahydromethanopterin reductase-like flavin-dependent oxidoreductase (luciferase family)
MKFGIDVAQQRVEFDELVHRVQFAESLGFDAAWGFDHFVPMYGEGPGNCFEGMTTLAALAGLTSRIRLGLLVTGVTYRHPSVFAAQTVTLDHASHGRLNVAVGAAWYEPEHRMLGIPYPNTAERFDRLHDLIEILQLLWSGERVSYEGHHVSLEHAQLRPRPVQVSHPPLWIGGGGPIRTLPLVARYADVWHIGELTGYSKKWSQIQSIAESIGRDPEQIARASSLSISEPLGEVEEALEERRRLGIEYLVCGWPGAGESAVRQFADAFVTPAGEAGGSMESAATSDGPTVTDAT